MTALLFLVGGAYFIASLVALAEISTGWLLAGLFIPPLDIATPLIYKSQLGTWPQPATLLGIITIVIAGITAAAAED